jgi:acyl-homoserine-lactone acylase
MVPTLVAAFEREGRGRPAPTNMALAIDLLRSWDYRWGVESVATSVAVYWAEALTEAVPAGSRPARNQLPEFLAERTSDAQKVSALATALDRLEAEFGRWRVPWGEISRFQRLTGDIVQPFSDARPSIPVGFTGGTWGSLASFGARQYPGTRRWYGNSGNSFVAVVEFGPRVRARAVTAGGASGDPRSPHFNDQAERYATGDLREVYFYPDQLQGHIERTYRPGE